MNESDPQHHAALAVPARRWIMDYLSLNQGGATVKEIADHLGQHPNTARFHLHALTNAGLIVSQPRRLAGRGRPEMVYRLIAMPATDVRQQMISVLAQAASGAGAVDINPFVRAGRQWGKEIDRVAGKHLDLEETLSWLGFSPERDGRDIVLHSCPFLEAAQKTPQVVCSVHQGLAAYIGQSLDPPQEVEVVPFARPDGCVVRIVSTSTTHYCDKEMGHVSTADGDRELSGP